ncbi:hypothetical protein [Micromonospora sp. WMMA1976]|uniref:hypothetical protein n=1 Tax=Micromonospora sp. WMMA1976 TaxID=3014995 RepID=UPI00248D34C3|nr:hypothetical protein [Micromonospora sp. WMMA1976]WBC05334.1 hypothetical protein O7546_10360 [Micromonospora sp. WMMA1976]
MHVLPAAIPAAEARRADLVEARLARKVAPLFGLAANLPPFHRSWVCDYTALSLAEIGRGAPSPNRAERSRLEAASTARSDEGDHPGWAWSGRSVWSSQQSGMPGALTNATLNRYGPDTKAAAVLAAANRLLRDAASAVAAASRHLAATGCDPEVRLAVWAGLILEAYRAQPALVVAAVQARQVQRSLAARWGAQVDRAGVRGDDAPAEIHPPNAETDDAPGQAAARWQPTSFDLVDATLPALRLADDPTTGPGLVTVDALDDIASAWCHRLLGIGRPGRGVVWLTEDAKGSRQVQAMVRVGAAVAPFVAATLGGTSAADRNGPPALPVLPAGEALATAPLLQRRAQLLVAHVAANYVRYRDEWLLTWPELRTGTRELVAVAVQRCAQVLDAEDPVPLQLRAYAAYLDVWDPARTKGPAGPAPGGVAEEDPAVRRLVATQQQTIDAWRSGRLDPGAAAYLLEIGVVALRGTGVDASTVGTWWTAILAARGLGTGDDLASRVDSVSDAQVFHLHHYVPWLAEGGRRADLRRALAVQERVAAVRAEVVRREPAGFAAKSAAARDAHERAAELATDLALATPERERGVRARVLRDAVRHVRAVLADPSTRALLEGADPQPAALNTARVVARALALAISHGLGVDPSDAKGAVALLDAATGSSDRTSAGVESTLDGAVHLHQLDGSLHAALRGWRADLAGVADRQPTHQTDDSDASSPTLLLRGGES